jgi:hypothetical protein
MVTPVFANEQQIGPALLAERHRKFGLTDMQALEEFVIDNADLEQLEDKLSQFNIFEAIGMSKQELRHSDFLGFLLDPRQPHGLGDEFLKKLLQCALLKKQGTSSNVNVVEVHLMDFDDVVVEREPNRIDILLRSDANRFAVIIENKLDSGEHDDQLDRYHRYVTQQHSDWKVIGIYLTIDGAAPTHSGYSPVSYDDVARIIDKLVESRDTVLGRDVLTVLTHYVRMLRRNVVSDAELNTLCLRIYQKHKRAIDLIVENLPDRQRQIMTYCYEYFAASDEYHVEYSGATSVIMTPVNWVVRSIQREPSSVETILRFYFRYFKPGQVILYLSIGPGRQEIRQKLHLMAQQNPQVFFVQAALPPNYCQIYKTELLSKGDGAKNDLDSIRASIHAKLSNFARNVLPLIQTALASQEWIWQDDAEYAGNGEMASGTVVQVGEQ